MKKLIEVLGAILGARTISFDPSSFDDPLAMQIEWTPAKRGGASFRKHKLVTVNSNRYEFRMSIENKLFVLPFLLVGVGMLIGFFLSQPLSGEFYFNRIVILPFGLIFSGMGGSMLYFDSVPIVFDKEKGFFWKGRKSPDEVFNRSSLKYFAELDHIYALQLISELCPGQRGSFHSYELNIVLKDGKRINVVDHGNKNKLRDDAATIADFLGIPVWDAID